MAAKGKSQLPLQKLPANYASRPGKQLYLKSLSPARAQSVIDGAPKAELRIVREPLRGAELYPAAGATRLDFFNFRLNQTTTNGLLLDQTLTNMQQAGTIGEPEIFDLMGISVVYEHGMPQDELNLLLEHGTLSFQFSSSQPVLAGIPLDQIPGSTGMSGVGHLFEQRNVQVGAPIQGNYFDVTVENFPRRIWSLETFQVFMDFRAVAPVLPAARLIRVYLHGYHYIR